MPYPSMPRAITVFSLAIVLMTAGVMAADLAAQEPPPLSSGAKFVAQTGQQLYQTSCQGCHMADGKGARGVGLYPALANNRNLAVSEFLIFVIMNGKSGMPGFRDYMSDEQIANVANHVRSSFGNNHGPDVTAGFVKDFSSR